MPVIHNYEKNKFVEGDGLFDSISSGASSNSNFISRNKNTINNIKDVSKIVGSVASATK